MTDVIVLGAGVAGLAAARAVAEAGLSVLVLEAQARIGGRLHTLHVPGVDHPIELGAEFIHGCPPDLLALLREAGLAVYEATGETWCYQDRALQRCTEDDEDGSAAVLGGMGAAVEARGDCSFAAYLVSLDATEKAKERARSYVEGFNAADAEVIGIEGLARQQAAEEAIEGDRAFRVARGYSALAEYLAERARAAGARLLLETPVSRIEWSPEGCTVHGEHGASWSAGKVICALPLGVLQLAAIEFVPAPKLALAAAHSLRAGVAQRVVLQFDEPWWRAARPDLRFVLAPGLNPPVWWTTAPRQNTLLTGWVGGPGAAGGAPLAEAALKTLETLFGQGVREHFVAAHSHDWQQDRRSRGAYSYAPAGAAGAAAVLATPVEGTLFFAGEHTDTTGHPGTVHGALRSGWRAARQVLTVEQVRDSLPTKVAAELPAGSKPA